MTLPGRAPVKRTASSRGESAGVSTAETKCAKWRRESVPVELREKGREALASCLTDLVFGVVVSIAGCFRGRRVTGSALSLLGCREPEAFTVHLQDMDMMGEAIEQRAREPLRSEDRGPFVEWQVAGHQRGAAFIALAEHLEEQFRTAVNGT
jgi:hypothetical protein